MCKRQHRGPSLAQHPTQPQNRQNALVSHNDGHQPTGGGTKQQGQSGRSRSPYLEVPLMRSINHFRGGPRLLVLEDAGLLDMMAMMSVMDASYLSLRSRKSKH